MKPIKDWKDALKRIEGAYSQSTLRAYGADVEAFVSWCEERGRRPLPASPKLLAAFVENEAERCSVATIKRRLAAIGKIHRLMKLENPVTTEDDKIALRRALRKKSARPRQAFGMTRDLRDRLIKACSESLAGKRDRAILAVGYDILARRSEIVALRIEDITQTSRGSKLIIRRAKNDQFGVGRVAHVSPLALTYLEEWLKAAKIVSGPLFRSIKGGGESCGHITPSAFNRHNNQARGEDCRAVVN